MQQDIAVFSELDVSGTGHKPVETKSQVKPR